MAHPTKRRLVFVTVTLALALASVACTRAGASTAATPSPVPSPATEAQALAAVQAYAPDATGLSVVDTEKVWMGNAYRVESHDIHAFVDQATGTVTSFLDIAALPTTGDVKLKAADALAAATAWLGAHHVDATGLTPTATLVDHGDTQEYRVELAASSNGARAPNSISVSLDPATGRVYMFSHQFRAYAPAPSPRLSLAEATAAAQAEEHDPAAKVTKSELAIEFDDAGTQILAYELDLTRSDGFCVTLWVDAMSGSVTVRGRG